MSFEPYPRPEPEPEPKSARSWVWPVLLSTGAVVALTVSGYSFFGKGSANQYSSILVPSAQACAAVEAGWSPFEAASKSAEQTQSWNDMLNADDTFSNTVDANDSNPLVIKLGVDLVSLSTSIIAMEGAASGILLESPGPDASGVGAAMALVASDERAVVAACK